MKLFDNHTHSYFSADSEMDIYEAVARAEDLGLGGIVLTDHIDLGEHQGTKDFIFDVAAQQSAIDDAVERLGLGGKGSVELLKGIEIGIDIPSEEAIFKVLRENSYDCVIASQHLIDGYDPYWGGYYDNCDYKYAYSHYLEVFYEGMVRMKDFDIIGHYDYIVRYAHYPQNAITYREFGDILDAIFKYLIDNGKSLEINTKTYQLYRGREPWLDIEVLKRFRELGGEALSFGSDAHAVGRIADKFEWCREVSKRAGIEYEVCYKGRKPYYIPL